MVSGRCLDRLARHLRARRVDADRRAAAHELADHRQHALALLVDGHATRARTRGLAAHVEQVRPLLEQREPVRDGGEYFDATIEVPVKISNPGKRIGTHVFTAMAKNDSGLRWSVVTIDESDDARSALDRVTIPQEVLSRVAPTALPRSSIIISDEPLSAETNYRTEFVAVLSNHPQGGFITRERTNDIMMAADDWRDDGYDPVFRDRRRGGPYNQNNQYQYNRPYQQPYQQPFPFFWR